MEQTKLAFTSGTARVLEILKAAGEPMVAQEIALHDTELFAKGARSVQPALNQLVKLGFATKPGRVTREVEDKDGNKVNRDYESYQVTGEGHSADYDIK